MRNNRIEIVLEGSTTKDFGFLVVNDMTLQKQLHRIKVKNASDVELYKIKFQEMYKNYPVFMFA